MGSDDLLVIAFALPPMWLSARLWWSARHAVAQLRESSAFAGALARRDDAQAFDVDTPSAPARRW